MFNTCDYFICLSYVLSINFCILISLFIPQNTTSKFTYKSIIYGNKYDNQTRYIMLIISARLYGHKLKWGKYKK